MHFIHHSDECEVMVLRALIGTRDNNSCTGGRLGNACSKICLKRCGQSLASLDNPTLWVTGACSCIYTRHKPLKVENLLQLILGLGCGLQCPDVARVGSLSLSSESMPLPSPSTRAFWLAQENLGTEHKGTKEQRKDRKPGFQLAQCRKNLRQGRGVIFGTKLSQGREHHCHAKVRATYTPQGTSTRFIRGIYYLYYSFFFIALLYYPLYLRFLS